MPGTGGIPCTVAKPARPQAITGQKRLFSRVLGEAGQVQDVNAHFRQLLDEENTGPGP